MSANTVKKSYINIYLAITDSSSGDTVTVCVPTPEINTENYDRSKVDAILATIVPCLDSDVAIRYVKKVEGYAVVSGE